MALRPKTPLTPEEIAIARNKHGERYVIMSQVGALMVMMTSISPFFAANHVPAVLILTMSIVYERWTSASKGQKRLLAYGSLLCVFFIGFNSLLGWFIPPEPVEAAFPLMPTFVSAEQTITFGYIGHWVAMFGAFQALSEIRLMPVAMET